MCVCIYIYTWERFILWVLLEPWLIHDLTLEANFIDAGLCARTSQFWSGRFQHFYLTGPKLFAWPVWSLHGNTRKTGPNLSPCFSQLPSPQTWKFPCEHEGTQGPFSMTWGSKELGFPELFLWLFCEVLIIIWKNAWLHMEWEGVERGIGKRKVIFEQWRRKTG